MAHEHPGSLDVYQRSLPLIGRQGLARLQQARVAVFGLGGVGAACVEALARAGVGHLLLVDHDVIDISNLNRQLYALHSTLGQPKALVAKARVKDICPALEVDARQSFLSADNLDAFEPDSFDAIADCVDTLSAKLLLAEACRDGKPYLISCMGAGNRMNPGCLRIADLYQTEACPLARRMRKACRQRGIEALPVLHSLEEPKKAVVCSENGRHSPASISFVPPVAGMMMAGEIIRHLLQRVPG